MYFDISEETRLNDELINTEQNILRVYVSNTRCITTERLFTTQSRLGPRTWVIEVPRGLTRLTFSPFLPAQEIGIEIDVALQMCVRLARSIDCRSSFLSVGFSVFPAISDVFEDQMQHAKRNG